MKQGKPNPDGDDLYLAVVSEEQGCYRFLSNGERRLSLAEAMAVLEDGKWLQVAEYVAETDTELRHS